MALRRVKQETGVEKVMQRFVEIASRIPEVDRIFLADDTDEGPRIWTVIDAPRFERPPRRRVYEAQWESLGERAESPVGFRLMNIQELKQPLEEVLPPIVRMLFQRKGLRSAVSQ